MVYGSTNINNNNIQASEKSQSLKSYKTCE